MKSMRSWYHLPALVAALGTTAAATPRAPLSPDGLWAPLPVRHVAVRGVDVAYVDSGGDKPPIVLVHGLSSYLGFWEYQIASLAEDHRVLALDLPGYGQSARIDPDAGSWAHPGYTPPWYADVVAGFLDAVGAPRATVVGHSMGGQIALTLALAHPERVDALVLSAPAGIETFGAGEARWMKRYWTPQRALDSTDVEVRASFTQLVFNRQDAGTRRLLDERLRLGRHPAFAGTSLAVSRSIAGMLDYPVAARLGEIRAPTLLIYGSDDRMIPNPVFTGGTTRAIAERGHRAIPGSTLVMISGAGHTVHHDAPDAFDAAVRRFLTQVPR